MSDQELKDLVASLAISQAKTDEHMKKLEISQEKTNQAMKNAWKNLNGIGKSQGEVAEEYFYNSLGVKMEINNIKFDTIGQNFYNKVGDIEGEYDLVLINGDTIGIIETKYKLKDEDVTHMINQQIPNFKILFPMYKDFKLYAGLAAFKISKSTQQKALKNGLFILKRGGEVMENYSEKLKVY